MFNVTEVGMNGKRSKCGV